MLVAAGARLKHLIATGTLGVVCGAVIILVSLFAAGGASPSYPLLRPHQVERIQAVVDQATGDTRFDHDRGFQGKQAQTLVGAGGWLGHSAEKSRALIHYSRVPEPHNDMISAVVGNRFGLIGLCAMVGLFLVWIFGALAVAAGCKDPFGRLVCVGFAAIVFMQMTVSIGMTVGLLPITGMTLPFVSYGGSSLVMGYVMVGILMNIGMRRAPYLWQPSFEYDGGDGSASG
jgi:rod shape determining protein RodA